MLVQKRGSRGYEEVKFDKITTRIRGQCAGLPAVDPTKIALATIRNLFDRITTEELDRISANIADSMKFEHPDYSALASRLLISNLHKTTPSSFSKCMGHLAEVTGNPSPTHMKFIVENASHLDDMIDHPADYSFDYFGYRMMENSYLGKITEMVLDPEGRPVLIDKDGEIAPADRIRLNRRNKPILVDAAGKTRSFLNPLTRERVMDRPQYLIMRVAIAIYKDAPNALAEIKKCYDMMSNLYFTHATPTLFNACAVVQQLGSCFLIGTGDSIEEIMRTLTNVSLISKRAGGIGVWQHVIRCQNSLIKGTNGRSSGLPKQLKMYNEASGCWDQGGGKRKGAFAIYLEPWHGDIKKYLQMKRNHGAESELGRDLFYAMWVSELFMKRLIKDENWSLFSEHTAPGLSDVYDGMDVCSKCHYCANPAFGQYVAPIMFEGESSHDSHQCSHEFTQVDAFTFLYSFYEDEGIAVDYLPADDIADLMYVSQQESGTPYCCHKDSANRMSNQSGIGTIKSSNLCTEIYEWSSKDSYATCTLASINLKQFLVRSSLSDGPRFIFDFAKLMEVTRQVTRNLNFVIDVNDYPVVECVDNARSYRPIAIGVQAVADMLAIMRLPFLSEESQKLQLKIAETIYFASLTESHAMAKEFGAFKGFEHSPAARGELHYRLWMKNQARGFKFAGVDPRCGEYDWPSLEKAIMADGLRLSLHIAWMPTVSTSQLLGNNESFEPFHSNLYTKTTIGGKFSIANKAMISHLSELGLWSEAMKNRIINNDGSVQGIKEIPIDVQKIYMTVWEMKQSDRMRLAALLQAFIDQGISLNIYLEECSKRMLRSVFILGYELGMKTGSYYIRSRPATKAMKNNIAETAAGEVCHMEEGCVACSS